MLAAGHPVVAVLLGLGAAGLGALMVAMAWNIHVRQFRLAELLARRQFTGTADPRPAGDAVTGNGDTEAALQEAALQETALQEAAPQKAAPQKAARTGGPADPAARRPPRRSSLSGRTRWSPASKRVTGPGCPGAAPWCRGRSAAARCRSLPTRTTPTSCC